MHTETLYNFFSAQPSRRILWAILALAFFVRVYNLHYNSPFVDEALYVVAGQEIWQNLGESSAFSWIGGFPFFYPSLTALFYAVGGIVGSRFLNVLLGTAAVYFMYYFAKHLPFARAKEEHDYIGLVAAFLLALLTIPVYLSRLANYDMLSFTLFLAGLAYLQAALHPQRHPAAASSVIFLIAAMCLFLSFLAKYVTLSFFPFIILWAAYHSWRQDRAAFQTMLRYFLTPVLLLSGLYILLNFGALREFSASQITADSSITLLDILRIFSQYTLLPFGGGIAALFLADSRRNKGVAAVLLGAALIMPLVHLLNQNIAAFHQHTFLSLIFLLPLVGYLIVQIFSVARVLAFMSVALGTFVVVVLSVFQVHALQKEWPNSDAALGYLRETMTPDETLFSFEDDVAVLALPHVAHTRITGIFNFEYNGVSDVAAYQQAVADGYFDWILFNVNNEGDVGTAVAAVIADNYVEVFSDAPLVVYRRR